KIAFDSLEKALYYNGLRDSRHHISHIEVFQEEDINRFKSLNVIANFQPLWGIRDEYITEHTHPKIGNERSQWLYPIGSVHRTGATIGFGSDWYVTSANPLDGIEAAVTRLEPNGLTTIPLGDNEEIDLATAIKAYTLNGAYVNFLDKKVGSIEINKQADFIVLDQNLFDIPYSEINETKVLETYFNGQLVYKKL
ncbi:MAG: amidohydrolase family protein, partial [Woeseiaceae bacterium]|nr:amidohydrolase family protein [Woeseiaceae bacterium]